MKSLIKILIVLFPLFSMAGIGGGGVGPRPTPDSLVIKSMPKKYLVKKNLDKFNIEIVTYYSSDY